MPARYEKITVTEKLLNSDPNAFFVFGDDLKKQNVEGSASLRTHPRAIGFVTKKAPKNNQGAFFSCEEYAKVFFKMLRQLTDHIEKNPARKFYISQLGADEANKYRIWDLIVKHNLEEALEQYDNVVLCWEK